VFLRMVDVLRIVLLHYEPSRPSGTQAPYPSLRSACERRHHLGDSLERRTSTRRGHDSC
jgi:hypothetical protein